MRAGAGNDRNADAAKFGASLAFGEHAFNFVLTGVEIPGSNDEMKLKAILDAQC